MHRENEKKNEKKNKQYELDSKKRRQMFKGGADNSKKFYRLD